MTRGVTVAALVAVAARPGPASAAPGLAGAIQPSLRPWKLAFQHIDRRLSDVTGLDVLASSHPGVRSLVRRGSHSGAWDSNPMWSPHGRYVVFVRSFGRQAGAALYVVRSDGADLHRVTASQRVACWQSCKPWRAWSPDGRRLAFAARRFKPPADSCAAPWTIDIVGRKGRDVRTVASFDSEVRLLDWSPDGKTLLYLVDAGSGAPSDRLFSIDAATDNQRLLASSEDEGSLGAAAWSPDGQLIAYERECIPALMGDIFATSP